VILRRNGILWDDKREKCMMKSRISRINGKKGTSPVLKKAEGSFMCFVCRGTRNGNSYF
jgi:hypothetical protein